MGVKDTLLHVYVPFIVVLFAVLYSKLIFKIYSEYSESESFSTGLDSGFVDSITHFGCSFGFVVFTIGLEQVIPYKSEWNRFTKQEVFDWLHWTFSIFPGEEIARALLFSFIPYIASFYHQPNERSSSLMLPQLWPHSIPFAIQVLISILLYEFAYYWFHRLSHTWSWMWDLHRLHHSSEFLTVSKGFRHSLLEFVIDTSFTLSIVALFNIPPPVLVWTYGFIIPVQILSHANLQVKSLPWFEWIIVMPHTHRVHHAVEQVAWNSNFGGYTLFWDLIFKTYVPHQQYDLSGMLGMDSEHSSLPVGFIGQYFSFCNWNKIDSDPIKHPGGKLKLH